MSSITLVNLTSHPIYLYHNITATTYNGLGNRRVVYPSKLHGELRLQKHATLATGLYENCEVPVFDITTLAATAAEQELPPRLSNTLYIVSRLVADVLRERDDFVFPYDLVRDDKGVVIGCTSLARFTNAEEVLS